MAEKFNLILEPGGGIRHYWRDIWKYRKLFGDLGSHVADSRHQLQLDLTEHKTNDATSFPFVPTQRIRARERT